MIFFKFNMTIHESNSMLPSAKLMHPIVFLLHFPPFPEKPQTIQNILSPCYLSRHIKLAFRPPGFVQHLPTAYYQWNIAHINTSGGLRNRLFHQIFDKRWKVGEWSTWLIFALFRRKFYQHLTTTLKMFLLSFLATCLDARSFWLQTFLFRIDNSKICH